MKTMYSIEFTDIDNFELLSTLKELSENEIYTRNIEYLWGILEDKFKESFFKDDITLFYEYMGILSDDEFNYVKSLIINTEFPELEDFLIDKYNSEINGINSGSKRFVNFLRLLRQSKEDLNFLEYSDYIFVGARKQKYLTDFLDVHSQSHIIVDKLKIKNGFLKYLTIYILEKNEE